MHKNRQLCSHSCFLKKKKEKKLIWLEATPITPAEDVYDLG